ncbi:hypothetical protein CpecA_0383 [Chlamydia pecorum IPTaLE]|nr:hypothetical protein CpecA_0383 [Chlamydia pecorum IPTaLE]
MHSPYQYKSSWHARILSLQRPKFAEKSSMQQDPTTKGFCGLLTIYALREID